MYIFIAGIITAVIIFLFVLIYSVFKEQITFFITGLDTGFSISDLFLLWKVAKVCGIETPTNLFWSVNSLSKCMFHLTNLAAENKTDEKNLQGLLSKLFDFRTKMQNQSDEKKGLETTISLDKGQKLRIILPGKGVFYSQILNNGKEMIINVPRQKNMIPVPAEAWDGKVVSIYLWRKGDARYVFDTVVTGHGLFLGESSISLRHTNNLLRTQKRKAVRAKCDINAQLFIIRSKDVDYDSVETKNGYKCHIEDISESGALIRIGGKGVENVQIKIQFPIQNTLVIMVGVVRTVEYNQAENQSLLHFECIHIDSTMRNAVLSYVYNMLPEKEKEVYDALVQTDADEKESTENQASDTNQTVINENAQAANAPAGNPVSGDASKDSVSPDEEIPAEAAEATENDFVEKSNAEVLSDEISSAIGTVEKTGA